MSAKHLFLDSFSNFYSKNRITRATVNFFCTLTLWFLHENIENENGHFSMSKFYRKYNFSFSYILFWKLWDIKAGEFSKYDDFWGCELLETVHKQGGQNQ